MWHEHIDSSQPVGRGSALAATDPLGALAILLKQGLGNDNVLLTYHSIWWYRFAETNKVILASTALPLYIAPILRFKLRAFRVVAT